jgi:hypothetical protein
MRGRSALAAGAVLILVGAGVVTAAWFLWDSQAPDAPATAEVPEAETSEPKTGKRAPPVRQRRPRPVAEAPDPDADVKAAWDAALALYKAGKPIEALTGLATWRKSRAPWFAVPPRPATLAEMERAALALLARAARTASLEEAARLAALLKSLLVDPSLSQEVDDLLAAAKRRAAAADLAVGADVIGKADVLADKQALTRHLQRFADRGPAPKKPDWVDTQLAAVAAANAAITREPDPLNIPDPAAAEVRRLDALEKLRQRDSLGLLDSIDGALAWLALHQAEDGRFGNDATFARCKALKHEPACSGASENHQLGTTALSVLAFLDFRDQDVKRLFEPTLARGVAWIVARQRADGAFVAAGSQRVYAGYEAAIAMIALGQAAASTGDKPLRDVVQRAIDFYAKHHGKVRGGYRYGLGQDGDLSVTGWYAQAIESATNAGAKAPDDMKKNIETFLGYVTRTGRHNFAYLPEQALSGGLSAVGMLTTLIVNPQLLDTFAEDWRQHLYAGSPANGNNTYALYYGVRVLLFLDGKLPEKWRGYLNTLAGRQKNGGPSAGMIPLPEWPWNGGGIGPTSSTAFATLTMEHSLYRR